MMLLIKLTFKIKIALQIIFSLCFIETRLGQRNLHFSLLKLTSISYILYFVRLAHRLKTFFMGADLIWFGLPRKYYLS